MLLSAVSVLGVAQSSSEIPEGLMNNPVIMDQLSVLFSSNYEYRSVRICFFVILAVAMPVALPGRHGNLRTH